MSPIRISDQEILLVSDCTNKTGRDDVTGRDTFKQDICQVGTSTYQIFKELKRITFRLAYYDAK